MNRRIALKNLMIASGALVALPAWAGEWYAGDINNSNSGFSVTEQKLLATVADTIIPFGNAVGALSVGVDKFLVKLLDDCYEKEVRDNVKKQLARLDYLAKKNHTKSFNSCTQLQRQALLLSLSASIEKTEKDFFNLMKGETIRGFSTSKEVMVKHLKYEVAPGHYYGCVNVKA